MRTSSLLAFCFLSIGLANCTAAPLTAVAMPELEPAVAVPHEDPRFSEGLATFRSGDEADSDGWIWPSEETVDWVLAGVTLTNGRGSDQVWFVRLSTPTSRNDGEQDVEEFTVPAQMGPLPRGAKISAPAYHVQIETFDHRGKLLDDSWRTIPGGEPVEGGFEALSRAVAAGEFEGASAEDLAKLAIAIQQIGRSGALRPIRTDARKLVVREPNILQLLLNLFRLNVRADFANAEVLDEPWVQLPGIAELPQYSASSPILLAGQHVINCRVVLGPLHGPAALTAGLLGFEMSHPNRPQHRLTVKIIATKPK